MAFEYRPIAPEEFPEFARVDTAAFGESWTAEELDAERKALEFDRTVAALESGALVGTTATLSLDIALPGGSVLPAGGLTWTGVLPTHRRRGVLTGMIGRQLELSVERGEALNLLLASESTIYGRFGYGPATYMLGFSIETVRGAFRPGGPGSAPSSEATGRFRVLDPAEAESALPPLFRRLQSSMVGAVGRTPGLWSAYIADPEHHRDGSSRLFFALHLDPTGDPDGYVAYRMKSDWDGPVSRTELTVEELIAADPDVHAALWRYCLDMDLVAVVRTETSPVDEPLRWLLRDPRRLRVDQLYDGLWVRILDVSAALAARTYGETAPGPDSSGRSDALVFEVVDRFRPATGGRYLLETEPGGAACSRTDRDPDVALDVADLGAAYLGATAFSTLVRAGRVRELTPGAALRADALFRTERPPWCSTHF